MTNRPFEILLVDDNAADVLYTQYVFEDVAFTGHLHVVGDGLGALAFLRREGEYAGAPRPDLVLLDVNMPRMGGLEVLAHLRADPEWCALQVVVMTSSASEAEVWRARDTGASAYLPKPVDPAAVLALLSQADAR